MANENWHLSRSVPIALIVALGFHAVATVWWASDITSSIEELQKRDVAQDARIEQIRRDAGQFAVQLGRIEEVSNATLRTVQRLSNRIEGMEE